MLIECERQGHENEAGDEAEWMYEAGGWRWGSVWGSGLTASHCVRQWDDTVRVWGRGMSLSDRVRQGDDPEWLCEAGGWQWVTVWDRGMTVSEFLRQGDDHEWLWCRGMTLSDCVRQGHDGEWLSGRGMMPSDCVKQEDDREWLRQGDATEWVVRQGDDHEWLYDIARAFVSAGKNTLRTTGIFCCFVLEFWVFFLIFRIYIWGLRVSGLPGRGGLKSQHSGYRGSKNKP
jgi:hypothetical protein